MQERRTDNRLLCAELVEVCWTYAGVQQRKVANLEDISLCGICLQIERSIAPATAVVVRYGDGELTGIVRYCTYRDMGFFLGIELDQNSRWSTQHYRPEHLLDPEELIKSTLLRQGAKPGSSLQLN